MKRATQVIVIFLCCSVGKIYGTTDRKPSTPAFQLMENTSVWIANTPRRIFPELDETRFTIEDSILYNDTSEDIYINEQNDTVYVVDVVHDNRLHWINVWNSKTFIHYTDSTVSISKSPENSTVYNNLIKLWETDLVRLIGNEAQCHIVPTTEHYLARIIFHKGATQIDTVSFLNLGDIEKLTNHQLDSLREVIRLNKLYAKADSVEYQTDIDSIPSTVAKKNDVEKDSRTINPQQPSLSWWQRIVDWFRRLWRAIFG
ncbi:MAG: hypothetical protein K2G41_07675 [Duncaniella sp.]|uniref:hypothetical protein n=1 Tax=Duncaniella sp. TaxID=2518496 RepID=UPI0023D54675|nr:hypothetical protein [Duncaniella sp.]MDE6090568.1 hypothetical protein [Duncaniella sp.]